MVHLAIADLLATNGRTHEAAARLDAVPEDIGFNIAFLGAIDRMKNQLRPRASR